MSGPPVSGLTGFLALATALAGTEGCKKKEEPKPEAPEIGEAGDAGPTAGEEPNKPERIVLAAVTLRTVEPERPVEIYEDELAKELGVALTASPWFFADAGEVPEAYRPCPARLELTVRYGVVEKGSHGVRALVAAVEAAPKREDGLDALAVRENVLAERPLEPGEAPTDGAIAQHVARAVKSVGGGVMAKQKLRWARAQELVSALSSSDVDLALWALEVIGERKVAGTYEAVVPLLRSADRQLSGAALGALVALGDPRAVDAITEQVEFSDHDQLRTVIEAVTAIGLEGESADAVEFLEFVASGHPDDDIKERARDGLDRLRRR